MSDCAALIWQVSHGPGSCRPLRFPGALQLAVQGCTASAVKDATLHRHRHQLRLIILTESELGAWPIERMLLRREGSRTCAPIMLAFGCMPSGVLFHGANRAQEPGRTKRMTPRAKGQSSAAVARPRPCDRGAGEHLGCAEGATGARERAHGANPLPSYVMLRPNLHMVVS